MQVVVVPSVEMASPAHVEGEDGDSAVLEQQMNQLLKALLHTPCDCMLLEILFCGKISIIRLILQQVTNWLSNFWQDWQSNDMLKAQAVAAKALVLWPAANTDKKKKKTGTESIDGSWKSIKLNVDSWLETTQRVRKPGGLCPECVWNSRPMLGPVKLTFFVNVPCKEVLKPLCQRCLVAPKLSSVPILQPVIEQLFKRWGVPSLHAVQQQACSVCGHNTKPVSRNCLRLRVHLTIQMPKL